MPNLSFLEHYRTIIKTPSISAFDEKLNMSNKSLIDILSGWFSDLGFSITIQLVPGAGNQFNMLAKIGSGEGGLLLCGPSDTVTCDDGRWQSDPFKVKQADGKLFGLGSCDMKGFFAFILEALKTIPLNKLKKPLYILDTADEETSMASARFFAE